MDEAVLLPDEDDLREGRLLHGVIVQSFTCIQETPRIVLEMVF